MKNIILAAVLAASFGGANAALVNGSFDDQVQNPGSWGVYQSLPGWTTASGSGIEVRNAVAGSAYDGGNYVELDSYSNSSMSQAVTTTAGALYTLSFAYSAREGVAYDSNTVQALWNGSSVATVSADGTGQSGNVWNIYSYTVNWMICEPRDYTNAARSYEHNPPFAGVNQMYLNANDPRLIPNLKVSQIRNPTDVILMIDENSRSIDDGCWAPQHSLAGAGGRNCLSNRHDRQDESVNDPSAGRGNVLFCDLHGEFIQRSASLQKEFFDPQKGGSFSDTDP